MRSGAFLLSIVRGSDECTLSIALSYVKFLLHPEQEFFLRAKTMREPSFRISFSETHPVPGKKASASKKQKVKLLSGGNPQIPKGEGDAPVQAYIAAMPEWKQDIGRRLDVIIVENVPLVEKAVKWNSPFYGLKDQGWFVSFHVFTRYVKVTFFRGSSLRPVPPGESKVKEVRYLDIYEDGLDEEQFAEWIRQASRLPGEFL